MLVLYNFKMLKFININLSIFKFKQSKTIKFGNKKRPKTF